MPIRRLSGRESVTSAMILVAGILAVASWQLHWAKFTFPQSPTGVHTVYVGHEKIGLYLGILLLVRAIAPWFSGPEAARRWMAWALVSGGIIAGFAVYDLATEKARAVDALIQGVVRSGGGSVGQATALVHGFQDQGLVRFSFSSGIYVALAAAALAMVAGVLNLTWARPQAQPPATPPSTASDETGRFWARPEPGD